MEPPLPRKPNVVFQILFLLFFTFSFYTQILWSEDIKDARLQKYKFEMFRPIEWVTFHGFITAEFYASTDWESKNPFLLENNILSLSHNFHIYPCKYVGIHLKF